MHFGHLLRDGWHEDSVAALWRESASAARPSMPRPAKRFGITAARQLQGKELSYNNINDTDAALECLAEFEGTGEAACVIVKHANPCGVAIGQRSSRSLSQGVGLRSGQCVRRYHCAEPRISMRRRRRSSPNCSRKSSLRPSADEEAIEIVARKKNLRLLLLDGHPMSGSGLAVKSVGGGLLVQTRDTMSVDDMELKVVTRRQPTAAELSDLRFAFRVAKHVKSNAIVYARDGATVGIGAGQMSRVDSARIAVRKSEDVSRDAGLAQARSRVRSWRRTPSSPSRTACFRRRRRARQPSSSPAGRCGMMR